MVRKTGDAGKVCRGSSDRSGGLAKTALMAAFKYLEWECDVMKIIELNVSVRDRQTERGTENMDVCGGDCIGNGAVTFS